MAEALSVNNWTRPFRRVLGPLRDFLISDDSGHGWAGGGVTIHHAMHPRFSKFSNREVLYESPFGVPRMEEGGSFPQLDRFVRMLNTLMSVNSGAIFTSAFRGAKQLMNLFTHMVGRVSHVAKSAYHVDDVLRMVSPSMLCWPTTTAEWVRYTHTPPRPKPLISKVSFQPSPGALGSFFIVSSTDDFETNPLPYRVIDMGNRLNTFCFEFSERADAIRKNYRKMVRAFHVPRESSLFSKSERISMVFNTKFDFSPVFLQDFRKEIEAEYSLGDAFLPMNTTVNFDGHVGPYNPNLRFERIREEVRQFIKENTELFGYVEKAYITHRPALEENDVMTYYVRGNAPIVARYDYYGLLRAIDDGDFLAMLRTAREERGDIELNFPFAIKTASYGRRPVFPNELPFTKAERQKLVRKPVTFYYRMVDDMWNYRDIVPYALSEPTVVIDKVPFYFEDPETFRRRFSVFRTTLTDNLQIIDPAKYFTPALYDSQMSS